ncbi:hypothetical protein ANN_07377 [Periplaneta americana]|uniref:DUF4817 domain-containing protein n=1 Tax=Periplaneta americana TaxID=6978 RepID=A0ABQ8SYG0_PERAM|nr:hypothetical protein ANN_07377 [Periplaneta americana]
MYTIPERVEMVLIHAGGLSLREAAEEYHRRHPDQPTPHHGSSARLMERFKTAGSIHDKKTFRAASYSNRGCKRS